MKIRSSTNADSWDDFYKKEIENFNTNSEDTGECWFDDSNAETKIIEYLLNYFEEGKAADDANILDVGTGNGHLLFQLHEELSESDVGEKAQFAGIDYSPHSVLFAKEIANRKYSDVGFKFEQVDLLQKECAFIQKNQGSFQIVLDKGTLDAIALNQQPIAEFGGKIGMEIYASQVSQMMAKGSILLITSCNFTESELIDVITESGTNDLSVYDKIEYPKIQFGGVEGSTVCSIAFMKK